jgi:galactokinase
MVNSGPVKSSSPLFEDLGGFAMSVRRPSPGGLRDFFDASRDVTVSRAPGRLDVMGGIADYSGSLVLELPIREGAFAAAQSAEDGVVCIASFHPEGRLPHRELTIPLGALEKGCRSAREVFSHSGDTDAWGAYVGGVVAALVERGVRLRGARLLVSSTVPEGKGVASSAAVTVAAMTAAGVEFHQALTPTDVAFDCQKVENLVAGAPCGVMDPMTTVLGEEGKLLGLLCQPAVVEGQVELPAGVRLFGIDSGVRHQVSGADYGTVRVAAFIGYRILAECEGFASSRTGDRVVVDDPKYGGYLANVPPGVLLRHIDRLPERMRGAEFLERWGGTTDSLTRVDPAATYPVRAATLHPVLEHERVRLFAATLPRGPNEEALRMLGGLMRASHESYSACGLGSDGTDLIVELVRAAPTSDGLFGAKITGGGSGGTVAVLAAAGADEAIERVAKEYAKRTGRETAIFFGSSPGAAAFGTYRLHPDGTLHKNP